MWRLSFAGSQLEASTPRWHIFWIPPSMCVQQHTCATRRWCCSVVQTCSMCIILHINTTHHLPTNHIWLYTGCTQHDKCSKPALMCVSCDMNAHGHTQVNAKRHDASRPAHTRCRALHFLSYLSLQWPVCNHTYFWQLVCSYCCRFWYTLKKFIPHCNNNFRWHMCAAGDTFTVEFSTKKLCLNHTLKDDNMPPMCHLEIHS